MPTVRSVRCCGPGTPFGSVSLFIGAHSAEIHVTVQDEPCCPKEFQSFLSALGDMRSRISSDKPFYILYNLIRCVFNPSYIVEQEKILSGSTACSIVISRRHLMMRSAVKLITSTRRSPVIKVHDSLSDGVRWIKDCQKTLMGGQ